MFWETSLLAVHHFSKPQPVYVGEAKPCTYFAPEDVLKTQQYALVVPHGDRFAVDLSNPDGKPGINAHVYIDERNLPATPMKESLSSRLSYIGAHGPKRLVVVLVD